jgi:hypothetical protein
MSHQVPALNIVKIKLRTGAKEMRRFSRTEMKNTQGEAFETTVTVILDGKKYQGCGKALH